MCVCLNRFQSFSGNIHHETESLSIFQSAHKHKLDVLQASERAGGRAGAHTNEYPLCSFDTFLSWMVIYECSYITCTECAAIKANLVLRISQKSFIARAHRQNCIKRHPIGRDLKIPMLMCTILLNHKGSERFHANNFYFNSIGYQAANGNRIQQTASTKIACVIIIGRDFLFHLILNVQMNHFKSNCR